MNEMNDLPHRFADHCPHAGMDKACPSCRRAFDVVASKAWAEGFDAGERDVMEHERTGWDRDCIPNPYREDDA